MTINVLVFAWLLCARNGVHCSIVHYCQHYHSWLSGQPARMTPSGIEWVRSQPWSLELVKIVQNWLGCYHMVGHPLWPTITSVMLLLYSPPSSYCVFSSIIWISISSSLSGELWLKLNIGCSNIRSNKESCLIFWRIPRIALRWPSYCVL